MAAILDLAHTVNRAHLADKHLGDFSCPDTHWLGESEKPPPTPFFKRVYSLIDIRNCRWYKMTLALTFQGQEDAGW